MQIDISVCNVFPHGMYYSPFVMGSVTVKFIHSEKATKFCKIFTLLLSHAVPVKSKVKI